MHHRQRFSGFWLLPAVFVLLLSSSGKAFQGPSQAAESPAVEKELVDLLRSDAPAAEKAIACKKLAIHGSDAAVPELAKLLPDPQLSSWARIALEAIPGAAADAALRNAAELLQGRLLVGMINSIGVRGDADAVALLTERLRDADIEVASAAAVALGHIGNAAAMDALKQSLAAADESLRSSVAEGLVLCAEKRLLDGNAVAAADIYDQIRQADVPAQRILEATRGAILARQQDGIPLLLETLMSPDTRLFQIALSTIREFPGDQIDRVLAVELSGAAPVRAALILQAMADRPQTVVLPAVLAAAIEGDRGVRLSAISALRRVGDVSCLAALLKIAIEADTELAEAAQQTLADLPGDGVDAQIVERLRSPEGKSYPLLLQLVGRRRIDAVEDVLKAVNNRNSDVRHAALVALGETVSLRRLPLLISQVIKPAFPEDAAVAQLALKTASIRMPDRDACAAELASALRRSPADVRTTLLEILADVGGSGALRTLAEAAKSNDPQLQDTSSRLLGKWNSVEAAPVLLDLATTAPGERYKVRALRGYIGLARKFAMSDSDRANMCQSALNATRRIEEHKLVMDVLQLHPSVEGLKLAIDAAQLPGLKSDATQTALAIAPKLSGKGIDVTEMLSGIGLEKVQLEILKAEYGAGASQTDVTEILKQQAGSLQLISLKSASYNTTFGGDPAPGVAKRLKVKYRINGKDGEATFAENAVIILPQP